ncbi:nitronate monooxygenase [Actinocorallia sp. A-T 12471]|uniref:NAD(P)H-dependent flavin oxidoreductase n=1 Tax=Actinocorallia sp. A-T 12471 TaxID=3089813 RepID=UPI0029CDB4B1|nr:nitronate monooxygenase [Actinocorallia sp. A-T 12471]MDX6744196.1 nitronate monooxygenase [Actinocorallia sp. A-T 12471]
MDRLGTALCARLGMRVPVVQAPIGSACTAELVAAVAAAGGLGMLSVTWMRTAEIRESLRRIRALTSGPFGVNAVLAFAVEEKIELCLAAGVRVVSTFWGDPAPYVERIHGAGAVHLHTVSSAAEAVAAVEAGVDVVVAQGVEAGGHVRGGVPTMVLVPAVVDAVGDVPVIAAGGIADGRGLAAALVLGAQGVWMGTRFLAAREAATHEVYRDRVIGAAETSAVRTLAFDGGWPDAPHRALENSTLRAWEAAGRPGSPDRPGEGDVVATGPDGTAYLRYGDMMPLPGMAGDLEAMALYAGCSAGLVHEVEPAAEIVARVVDEARGLLS